MRILAALSVALTLCQLCMAQPQSMDAEIGHFADRVAAQIKESGGKKIAVLAFTDLQGAQSDLGRFLCEELSVNLVERRNGSFSVVDRANLKVLLTQHKLTEEGLIDPKNTKELGKFSDVDAIIIGTVTMLEQDIAVTAKLISTETAEIMGAAKARLPKAKDIGSLSENTTSRQPADNANRGNAAHREIVSRSFGNVVIAVESFRALDDRTILMDLSFRNKGASPVAVGLYCYDSTDPAVPLKTTLLGSDGTQFAANGVDLTGIRSIRINPHQLTEISPGEGIQTTVVFRTRGRLSALPSSLRLQSEIVINHNYSASSYPAQFEPPRRDFWTGAPLPTTPALCQVHNFVADIPTR